MASALGKVPTACTRCGIPGKRSCDCEDCQAFHETTDVAPDYDALLEHPSLLDTVLHVDADSDIKKWKTFCANAASTHAPDWVGAAHDIESSVPFQMHLEAETELGTALHMAENATPINNGCYRIARFVYRNNAMLSRQLGVSTDDGSRFLAIEFRVDKPSSLSFPGLAAAHVHIGAPAFGDADEKNNPNGLHSFTSPSVFSGAGQMMGPFVGTSGPVSEPVYVYEANAEAQSDESVITIGYDKDTKNEDIKRLQALKTYLQRGGGNAAVFDPAVHGKMSLVEDRQIWIPVDIQAFDRAFPEANVQRNVTAYLILKHLPTVLSTSATQFSNVHCPDMRKVSNHCIERYVTEVELKDPKTHECFRVDILRLGMAQIHSFINGYLASRKANSLNLSSVVVDLCVSADALQRWKRSLARDSEKARKLVECDMVVGVKGVVIQDD